ncbi:24-dehydrocholesterol reductase-like protein precursor [Sporormia fimetaria CBS 119925]|uniref:Delta(24)-sterol reductase n=1 Tax=Sporormia fimetaria CBS 119925 TaxID=1340428 RepID=A0A6A6V6P5_9PLEO|nr:24-dehydrocholesterol reductase-like protein precursor [Sporormia fimetaria CBS 119925]
MTKHIDVVKEVADAVRSYYLKKVPFRIAHGSTNSTRPYNKENVVNISKLRHVLKVDTEKKVAHVEPNVPMDRLVEATLPHGLVPPVVMEFPGITAGGGYAGTAGESSSFKYGFFDRNVKSIGMVLADGSVVTASEEKNADLFRGAAGAVGTLGITTVLELKLIDAKKFVKATYHPTRSTADAIKEVRAQTKVQHNDYVDGILFSQSHGAIVTGELTDNIPADVKPQTFSHPWDPWFYMHVEEKTRAASGPVTEYIPLAEYMFRYDRGGFWVGKSAFDYMRFPFTAWTRWWLDDFLHTRMLYRALHASGQTSRYVVQDMALPYPTAKKFIDYTDKTFNIWPLWLCPLKQSPQPTMHPHTKGEYTSDQMLNIGLWGFGPKNKDEFLTKNRDLEKKLKEFGGMKWLYAQTYYTKDEFWSQFDKKWYDGLREKYNATTLPDVHDKVFVDFEKQKQLSRTWTAMLKSIWPLGGFYGIYKAIKSRDYKIPHRSSWRWNFKPEKRRKRPVKKEMPKFDDFMLEEQKKDEPVKKEQK